jgi:hypothetical protein
MSGISLNLHAESIANTMHELAQWSQSHPNSKKYNKNLIKLPPVFLLESKKNGNGLNNLIAMIKTIAEYEEGNEDGVCPKLIDLPYIYNKNGGQPSLGDKDLRKIHNWVQQVSFGIRAAILEQEEKSPLFKDWESISVSERVFRRLYAHNDRRSFITCSAENKNEYKPLKYADDEAKIKWIEQECLQRKQKRLSKYGAQPTPQEWKIYGLSGQPIKKTKNQLKQEISILLKLAEKHDSVGQFKQADEITCRINKMNNDLTTLENKNNCTRN